MPLYDKGPVTGPSMSYGQFSQTVGCWQLSLNSLALCIDILALPEAQQLLSFSTLCMPCPGD